MGLYNEMYVPMNACMNEYMKCHAWWWSHSIYLSWTGHQMTSYGIWYFQTLCGVVVTYISHIILIHLKALLCLISSIQPNSNSNECLNLHAIHNSKNECVCIMLSINMLCESYVFLHNISSSSIELKGCNAAQCVQTSETAD